MKTIRPCYAIVIPCDGSNGEGRPIVMEGYLDLSFREVEQRAELMRETYGDALIVELPVNLKTETIRVAGFNNRVFEPRKEMPF